MITGFDEYSRLKRLLKKFDLLDEFNKDSYYEANYCVAYGGLKSVMWDSHVEDDEMTEEEEDAMFLLENGFDAWMARTEAIILGEEDE